MDPFVSNASVKQPENDTPVTDEEFQAELKIQYKALPHSLSSLLTFEYFEQQSQTKRESIETQIRLRSLPKASSIPFKQQDNLTLLSLYERADNPALWQYYGDNHQGIAIELDQSHKFFTAPHYKDAPQMFRPVEYSQERPLELKDSHPFISLFHRSETYAHDREWRVLRPAAVAEKKMMVHDHPVHLHRMPTGIIKSVTFGATMNYELKETLKKLLKNDLRYRQIPMMECCLDPTQYRLHREPVDSS